MSELSKAQVEPRLSEAARRILVFASDHAGGLGHGFVTCQHVLYALSQESGGLLAAALESLNIEAADLENLLLDGAPVHDRVDEPPLEFSDEVIRMLKRAASEAHSRGEDVVDPDHLLIAVLSEPSSADELLERAGTGAGDVRVQWAVLQRANPSLRRRSILTIRLTMECAGILAAAEDTARQMGEHEVTSAYLLHALVTYSGEPGRLFVRRFGLSGDGVLQLIPGRSEVAGPQRHPLPLAGDAQGILGCALGMAWERGHLMVTPVHLAMGLACAPRHAAHDLLADLGVSQSELIDALEEVMPPAVNR